MRLPFYLGSNHINSYFILEIKKCNQTDVLIAYSTKAGSTAEVAAKIGEVISQRGFGVDVLPLSAVNDLSAYDTVILGSAVRVGNVLPEMTKFVEKHQDALKQKVFSSFFVCMTLIETTPETLQTVSAYLEPIRILVKPVSEGMFAGVLSLKKLGMVDRMLAKMVKIPEGDYRQWALIEEWAKNVPCA